MFSNQSCPTCQTPNFFNPECSDCVRLLCQQQSSEQDYLQFDSFSDQLIQPIQEQSLPSFDNLMLLNNQAWNILNQDYNQSTINFNQIPEPISPTQQWLNENYPSEARNSVTELTINSTNLTGSLIIDNWPQLGKISCSQNNLTDLTVINCPNLKQIDCKMNKLTNLNLTNLPQLENLYCSYNQLTNLDFLTNLNQEILTYLNINNNEFTGSLVPLQSLTKLKELSINNTNFTTGLESLPISLKNLYCDHTVFVEELEDFKDWSSYDYKNWRKWQEHFTSAEIKQWIKLGLKGTELELAWHWKKQGLTPDQIKEISIQVWLDFYYPLDKRNDITKLDISYRNWTGSLDLSDFVNLEKLNCYKNKLTNLILPQSEKLTKLDCRSNSPTQLILPKPNKLIDINVSSNLLTSFDYSVLNPKTLKKLELNNNNLETTDLSVLSPLINLTRLEIGNNDYYLQKGNSGNQFTGSLESCKNLTKLGYLDISNTNINQGFPLMLRRLGRGFKFSHNKEESKPSEIASLEPNQTIKIFIDNKNQTTKKGFNWINYAEFTNIDPIAEGGYGKVYLAIHDDKRIALKSFKKTTADQAEYEGKVLQEITNHHLFNNKKFIKCLGLSQDPDTQEYIMAMEYVQEGDLRTYLKESEKKIWFGDKLKKLVEIATGLVEIHEKGLVHKDFHSGNILKKANSCYLTDLGQCEPESEQAENNEKFLGVLPYVAPEVLQGGKYTSAADIYSFGIIMVEMINQLPPHCYEDWQDKELRRKIILENFRPKINFQIPQLLQDLIDQCCDGEPDLRPTVEQIKEIIESWLKEKGNNKIKWNTEFHSQYQACEKLNKKINLSDFKTKEFHPSTHYHSKWIPTLVQDIFNKDMDIDQSEPLSNSMKRNLSLSQEETVKQDQGKKTKSEIDYREEYKKLLKWVNSLKSLFKSEEEKVFLADFKKRTKTISAESEVGFSYQKAVESLREEIKKSKEVYQKFNSLFEEKEKEITYLEKRVEELTVLIKNKREKIAGVISRLLPDKEREIQLIQELIITHLEFIKAKKQNLPSVSLRRQRDNLRSELEDLLGNDFEEKIESSLTDCEELVSWEVELEERLDDKGLLIAEQKQNPILRITNSESKELVLVSKQAKIIACKEQTQQTQLVEFEQLKEQNLALQLELAKQQGKLEIYEKQFTASSSQEITTQLISYLQSTLFTLEDQAPIKDLLGAKRIFLNTRQITIKGLQNCYNKLKGGDKKYAKAEEVGNVITAGVSVAESLTFGIPKALGETILSINNSFKRKFSDKQVDKFKELLDNDKEVLYLLNNDIINKLKLEFNTKQLFSLKYKIFAIDNSIWAGKFFNSLAEMEAVIIALTDNLQLLAQELQQEEQVFNQIVDSKINQELMICSIEQN